MLRRLAVAVASLATLLPAATTIAESRIVNSTGGLAGGTIELAAKAPIVAGAARVETQRATVRVVNGAFAVTLEPGRYTATWQLDKAVARTEEWLVTASATPLRVRDVVTGPVPIASLLQVGQLNVAGLADGCWAIQVTNGVASWTSCGTGGGGTPAGSLFDTYTGLFDSATGLFDAH